MRWLGRHTRDKRSGVRIPANQFCQKYSLRHRFFYPVLMIAGYRAFSNSGTTTTIKASEQQFGRKKMWACFSGMLATCKEGDV